MAVVPDRPVRIREYLSDGTAYEATVSRYEETDDVVVLDSDAADVYGVALPPVYYTAEEAQQLDRPTQQVAVEEPLKPAKPTAAPKGEETPK